MSSNWIYTPTTTTNIVTTTWYPAGDYWYNRRYCDCCGWYWGYSCPCSQKFYDGWKQQELEKKVAELEKEVKRLKRVPRDNTQVFLQKRRGK